MAFSTIFSKFSFPKFFIPVEELFLDFFKNSVFTLFGHKTETFISLNSRLMALENDKT